MPKLESIGRYAFSGCTSLGLKEDLKFVIPKCIKSIGEYVFYNWMDKQTIYLDKDERFDTFCESEVFAKIMGKGDDGKYKFRGFRDKEDAVTSKEDVWNMFVSKFRKLNIEEYKVRVDLGRDKTVIDNIFKDDTGVDLPVTDELLETMKVVLGRYD